MLQASYRRNYLAILFCLGSSLSAHGTSPRQLRGAGPLHIEGDESPTAINNALQTYGTVYLTSMVALGGGLYWQKRSPQHHLTPTEFSQYTLIIGGSIFGTIAYILDNIQAIRIFSLASSWRLGA